MILKNPDVLNERDDHRSTFLYEFLFLLQNNVLRQLIRIVTQIFNNIKVIVIRNELHTNFKSVSET